MKHLIGLLAIAVLLVGCTQKFKVKGTIQNMPEQKFRLEELAIDGNVFIDSGTTKPDGSFELSATNKEESLYRIKFLQGKYILLALKNGDQATISGDWNSLENYTVSGSEGSASIKGFLVNMRENINDIRTINMILDSLKAQPGQDSLVQSAQTDLRQINLRFLDYVKKFADTTKSVASALFAVNIINPAIEGPYVRRFYEGIGKRFPESKNAAAFAEKFLGKPAQEMPAAGAEAGKPAPDFSAETPDGQTMSLQQFRGKYVLVDFWASWCAPCRQENPNLVGAYSEFSSKNFTILGVSLDTDKGKWKEAIAADKLSWNHVSELKGWASAIARNYHVESIPQNFLIDPNGNIIGSNLKGADLSTKLRQVFSAN
jgi:peroxiredoxin